MENKELNLKKYIWIAIILVLVLWGLNWVLLLFYDNGSDRGTFGDMFGTVNALFSGLAFAGIIITILLQRRELELQREEMKLQRKELENTRAEFEMQNETMKLQRFENTFFQMVDLHHKIISTMQIRLNGIEIRAFHRGENENEIRGNDALNHYCQRLRERLSQNKQDTSLDDIYHRFYSSYKKDLGHYFRNLYRIIKLVHESDLTGEKATKEEKYKAKYKYTSIIRAQLSDDEKILLYYNCHTNYGKKFRPLINQYSLLKGVNPSELPFIEARNNYENEAFSKPRTYTPELA